MKNIIYTFVVILLVSSCGNTSKLWNNYSKTRKQNKNTSLIDFSYAGYKMQEQEFNLPDYKVFDITMFGAIANDNKSDKQAIIKAIAAAEKNGSGIIFFPKGRYDVNDAEDEPTPIYIKGSNIFLKGEGSGVNESVIFMENHLPPKDSSKMWTCPYMINFAGTSNDKLLADITKSAISGSYTIEVDNSDKIKSGDWIIVKLVDKNKQLIEEELAPMCAQKEWTSILDTKGVLINEYHKVRSVKNNFITLEAPIIREINPEYNWQVYSYGHIENIGVLDLAFEGNWKSDFKHHRSWLDDGGYSMLKISRSVDSWVENCRFTDLNRAANTSQSAHITITNTTVTGTPGHNSISANSCTRVLLTNIHDSSSQWHAQGVAGTSIGNVIHRCTWTEHTCFESHAAQPRYTLFDCVEGGFFLGRAGGARQNLPNHLKGLVLWNYKKTDAPIENFEFWSSKTWYWKIVQPTVVGMHGSNITFVKDQVGYEESTGTKVNPESLFEAQLEFRQKNNL